MKRRAEVLVRRGLERHPVVALLGPRQVGKTTLARAVVRAWPGEVVRLDLERPAHVARLRDLDVGRGRSVTGERPPALVSRRFPSELPGFE